MNETGHALAPTFPASPDAISTGQTEAEVKRNIREAIELHLSGMREDGEAIPEPTTLVDYVPLAS